MVMPTETVNRIEETKVCFVFLVGGDNKNDHNPEKKKTQKKPQKLFKAVNNLKMFSFKILLKEKELRSIRKKKLFWIVKISK